MAATTRYVVRWNATAARKECRRLGELSFVVGGGVINPGSLIVGLSGAPNPATVGQVVTLSATVTGGTGPYTYAFSQTSGTAVSLAGSGAARTFTAVTTSVDMGFRVVVTDSAAAPATDEATATVAVTGSQPAGSLFAGHVPNRVLVGMATPQTGSNVAPDWTEARAIIGQPIYEARRFRGDWISTNLFNEMVNEGKVANAYPIISFKVPGGSNSVGWNQVSSGSLDNDLISLFNLAVGERTGGPGGTPFPFACSFEHEPAASGITDADLSNWARMHEYCCWFFAGRRGGTATSTYNAAHDCRDIMAWAPVGNGFWWRANTPTLLASASAAFPQSLIDALRICRGIMLNDTYDCDYVDQAGALTDESLRTPGTGVRTNVRLSNLIAWARARNCGAIGAGEYGVIDGAEMTRCWQVMRANRDIWAIANYFNSQNNSDHEWRIVPSDYPAGNPTGSKGLVDFGGNAQSQGRLDAFKVTLTESISATYTGPL